MASERSLAPRAARPLPARAVAVQLGVAHQRQGPGGRPGGQVAGGVAAVLLGLGRRVVDGVDHDHGDVVRAALVVGDRDQLPRAAARALRTRSRTLRIWAGSTTSERPSLHTRNRSPRGPRGWTGRARVVGPFPSARVKAALRVRPRLGLGDPALVDERLHVGVVVGDLRELAVAQQVGAGVADVGEPDPAARPEQRR